MKLCGQISVELNVGDYIEAADHQRLEDIPGLVRDAYPDAIAGHARAASAQGPAALGEATGYLNRRYA